MWGSNLQHQLGKKTTLPFLSTPTLSTAFQDAKSFKVSCGSYHTVCLSYRMPRQEDQGGGDDENVTPLALRKEETKAMAIVQQEHTDEGCPNVEQIKKLKGEIKRLRQDLIMKGTTNKKRGGMQQDEDNLSDDSELDEDEKAIVRMMP